LEADAWLSSNTDNPVFGYRDSTYWAKLTIEQIAYSDDQNWLLEIAYPHLDELDVFIFNQNSLQKKVKFGDHLQFLNCYIDYRNFVLPLELKNSGVYSIYFKVKTSSSIQFPIKLYRHKNFIDIKLAELFNLGLYYGIVFVMMIYNFFLYLSFRDKVYIYYVLYMLGWIGFQLSYTGLAFQYLWPHSPDIVDKSIPFFQGFSGVFFLLFSINFLKTKEYTPVLHQVLRALVVFCVVDIFMIFFSTKIAIIFGVASGFLLSISGLMSAVLSLIKGYRPARFFVLAFAAFLFGLSILTFSAFGIIESEFASNYAVQIGSALEAVLLSFALGDKINIEQQAYTDNIKQLNNDL
jgi:hypothetical protein